MERRKSLGRKGEREKGLHIGRSVILNGFHCVGWAKLLLEVLGEEFIFWPFPASRGHLQFLSLSLSFTFKAIRVGLGLCTAVPLVLTLSCVPLLPS